MSWRLVSGCVASRFFSFRYDDAVRRFGVHVPAMNVKAGEVGTRQESEQLPFFSRNAIQLLYKPGISVPLSE